MVWPPHFSFWMGSQVGILGSESGPKKHSPNQLQTFSSQDKGGKSDGQTKIGIFDNPMGDVNFSFYYSGHNSRPHLKTSLKTYSLIVRVH